MGLVPEMLDAHSVYACGVDAHRPGSRLKEYVMNVITGLRAVSGEPRR